MWPCFAMRGNRATNDWSAPSWEHLWVWAFACWKQLYQFNVSFAGDASLQKFMRRTFCCSVQLLCSKCQYSTSLQRYRPVLSTNLMDFKRKENQNNPNHARLAVNLLEKDISLLQLASAFCWLKPTPVPSAKKKVKISIFDLVNSWLCVTEAFREKMSSFHILFTCHWFVGVRVMEWN